VITALQDQLDRSFAKAVQGHVIVSGVGTPSAIAGQLAHLLTCVGPPALYLDAGQSAHGLAAAVRAQNVLFAISKGGETDKFNALLCSACVDAIELQLPRCTLEAQ